MVWVAFCLTCLFDYWLWIIWIIFVYISRSITEAYHSGNFTELLSQSVSMWHFVLYMPHRKYYHLEESAEFEFHTSINMASPPPHYEQFPVHSDPSTVGQRWSTYIKRMENMFVGFNITDDKQTRCLLLYYAGTEVSELFDTLPNQGTTFDDAVKCLTDYFSPKKNVEFERFKFREEKQRQCETVDAFHLRLQQLAKTCVFKEKDAEIKSQIIRGCLSSRLRRKALREEISLKELLDHARASELSEMQALSIEKSLQPNFVNSDHNSEEVNKVSTRGNQNKFKPHKSFKPSTKECYFCGGKYPHENKCPASDKKCNYCHKIGHFEKCCHSKSRDNSKSKEKSEIKQTFKKDKQKSYAV